MKRWPLIRHVRYYWHFWQAARWWALWGEAGYVPNAADVATLDAIWRGEA